MRVTMFRKTKIKLVVFVMLILFLLLTGAVGMIYYTTYRNVYLQNIGILQEYAARYEYGMTLSQLEEADRETDVPQDQAGDAGTDTDQHNEDRDGRIQKAAFYSVLYNAQGEITDYYNQSSGLPVQELKAAAQKVLSMDKDEGEFGNLIFIVRTVNGQKLVVMVDNTVLRQNIFTLIRQTVRIGGGLMLILLGLTIWMVKRLINPLDENDRKQKQFISDAGHELKTPVAAIQANADLLEQEIGVNKWLENIRYEGERMTALTGQLLDLARAQSAVPVRTVQDLGRIVTGAALPMESVAYEHGYALELEIGERLELACDRRQMEQLVTILVDNAITHAQGEGKIQIRLFRKKGNICMEVINPGKEIPKEKCSQIFERFYQTEQDRSEPGHYGLGLAIAKAIVMAYHGRISVIRNEKYTKFITILPEK